MDWLSAPEYWLAQVVFQRLLGLVYLVAFASVYNQFATLVGERGLLPVRRYLATTGLRRAPSVFHFHYSDRFARVLAATGMLVSAAVVAGGVERLPLPLSMAAWTVLWLLYLSFVNSGQTFFGFAWETLLLETGFLAIFLGNHWTAPALPVILLLRWLLFRLEFGAGLIKVRNDVAWRDLTALYYHHETQPIPNRFSRRFHHLPKWMHKAEVVGNHIAQLVVPIALFLPQPVASVAGAVVVVTQLWLMLSGNFAWLNLLSLTLAVCAFDDTALRHVVPVDAPRSLHDVPVWFGVIVIVLTVAMLVLSWRPARNMASRQQVMNASYNSLRIGNTYGLFGHITRERFEVVVEGCSATADADEPEWQPYEFKAKPGDVRRRPRQVAPYHLRLDWMMWFAALSPSYAGAWFVELVTKLLEGDERTLRLLRTNPFADRPPDAIRALLYRYRFSTRDELRRTGAWWQRELVGVYMPPVSIDRSGER